MKKSIILLTTTILLSALLICLSLSIKAESNNNTIITTNNSTISTTNQNDTYIYKGILTGRGSNSNVQVNINGQLENYQVESDNGLISYYNGIHNVVVTFDRELNNEFNLDNAIILNIELLN